MMRTLSSAAEKNAKFKSKYSGLNKISNQTNLLTSNTKDLSNPKITITHKATIDSGPLLISNTIDKNRAQVKLPYGQGENIETNEFGDKVWKHQNRRIYEEKIKYKVRKEPNELLNSTDEKQNIRNESNKLISSDLNNNCLNQKLNGTSRNAYIYGMTRFSGGETDDGLNSSSYPYMDQPIMIDKAIQCELKKTKKSCNLSEIRLKNFTQDSLLNEKSKVREYSSDKWFYDKHEFDTDELYQGKQSRQIEDLGGYKTSKWTKKINPSSLEQKVDVKKKSNTEYKTGLSASFRVIQPDKNGAVTAYSNVPPLNVSNTRRLGRNAAGQNVASRPGEVIYSQVDKSKKRLLRDQTQSPLPSYTDDISDAKLEEDKTNFQISTSPTPVSSMPKSVLKPPSRPSSRPPSRPSSRLASRSPSPINRNKLIFLNIPSEKQKAKQQYLIDSLDKQHTLSYEPNKVIRTKTYTLNYNPDTIEPPPQFSSLGRKSKTSNKLPPRAPTPKMSTNLQRTNNIRRIPIEQDPNFYLEQTNLSDHSSVLESNKQKINLEDDISIVSSSSEFDLNKTKTIENSTIKELDKRNKKISYENQPKTNAKRLNNDLDAPLANSIWYKSLDEDYRKSMAANDICVPNVINGTNNKNANYSSTMSRFDQNSKEKKFVDSLEDNRNIYTLDKKHLENKKRQDLQLNMDKMKHSVVRRATMKVNDFLSNKENQKFHSTKDLSTLPNSSQFTSSRHLASSQLELAGSRNAFRNPTSKYYDSESSSIASNIIVNSPYHNRSLNYPLKPVTRSASMYGGSQLANLNKAPSATFFRSTESDAGCGYNNNAYHRSTSRPISRVSSNFGGLHQNDPVVLYLPAIDNSAKTKLTKIGNKKLASSVNDVSSINRKNSILSKFRANSKKDLSKSSEKLNEVTTKLNQYSTNDKKISNTIKKLHQKKVNQIKRSQSIPKNTKLPFFHKLRNKLKTKD